MITELEIGTATSESGISNGFRIWCRHRSSERPDALVDFLSYETSIMPWITSPASDSPGYIDLESSYASIAAANMRAANRKQDPCTSICYRSRPQTAIYREDRQQHATIYSEHETSGADPSTRQAI